MYVVFLVRVYDVTADSCCNGVVTPGVADGKCCGDRAYDSTSATCCPGGTVEPKAANGRSSELTTSACAESKDYTRGGPDNARRKVECIMGPPRV